MVLRGRPRRSTTIERMAARRVVWCLYAFFFFWPEAAAQPVGCSKVASFDVERGRSKVISTPPGARQVEGAPPGFDLLVWPAAPAGPPCLRIWEKAGGFRGDDVFGRRARRLRSPHRTDRRGVRHRELDGPDALARAADYAPLAAAAAS